MKNDKSKIRKILKGLGFKAVRYNKHYQDDGSGYMWRGDTLSLEHLVPRFIENRPNKTFLTDLQNCVEKINIALQKQGFKTKVEHKYYIKIFRKI